MRQGRARGPFTLAVLYLLQALLDLFAVGVLLGFSQGSLAQKLVIFFLFHSGVAFFIARIVQKKIAQPVQTLLSWIVSLVQGRGWRAPAGNQPVDLQIGFRALRQIRVLLQSYAEQLQKERAHRRQLQEISLILTQFAPPEKTFVQLLPHLSQLLEAQASLFLKKDGQLIEFTEAKAPFAVEIGEGIAGLCAKEQSLIIANHAREHPAFVEGETPFAHLVCLPLTAGEDLLGVLSFFRKEDPPFAPEEVEVVEPMARLLSSYLRNLLLQQEMLLEPKTGLYIFPFFEKRCQEEVQRSQRYGSPFSVLLLDLDHFKGVNDVYGHLVGDQVLVSVAKLLKQELREADLPCRFGGEEFAVLLPSTDRQGAKRLADRLLQKLRALTLLPDRKQVTASIGITSFLRDDAVSDLLERADRALYCAKQEGRNCARAL